MGVMEARRRILLNQPHLIDASGNPISFSTDMAAKMGVKAHFSPVQEGTGDPSPSNVRPISGWTGCTVSHSGADTSNPTTYPVTFPAVGKNLLDVSNTTHNNYNIGTIANPLKPNTQYTFSVNGTTTSKYKLYVGTLTNPLAGVTPLHDGYVAAGLSVTFITPPEMTNALVLAGNSNSAGNVSLSEILPMIESGSTATSYEPFTNTLYGGYVDYEKGEVVAEYQYISLKDLDPLTYGSPSYDGTLGTNVMYYIPKASRSVGSYSNKAKGTSAGTWDNPNANIWKYTINSNTQLHVVCDNNIVGITQDMTFSQKRSTFKQWLQDNNMIFVMPIVNDSDKVIYSLTPTLIKSLKGANTAWSDTNGNVDIKYWKH